MPSSSVLSSMRVCCVSYGGEGGGDQVVAGHRSAGDDWGVLAGFMCDRACRRISSVAEERFSRLVNATPEDFGDNPGRLLVGSCSEAVQWAGYHCELSMDAQ